MNRCKMVCLLMLTQGSVHTWKNLVFRTKKLTVQDLRILMERVPGYFLISTGFTDMLPSFIPPRKKKQNRR